MPGKHKLALESIHIEQECLKETVGSQDQVLAAYGGFNHILFLPNGEISVRPVTLSRDRINELNAHLMLFYTGIKRTSSNIAESYVNNIDNKRRQMRIMKDLVEEGLSVLNSDRDILEFGELLNEAWNIKCSLSGKVSNSYVDEIYNETISAGAIGGKITGAGGGGFMLIFAPLSSQQKIRERLRNLIYVPFKFEFSGSQIIFCDAEEDYSALERARFSQEITFKEAEV
jgi:D-glycero-alpha-D-manno-heptose-7-phosphate kinase